MYVCLLVLHILENIFAHLPWIKYERIGGDDLNLFYVENYKGYVS